MSRSSPVRDAALRLLKRSPKTALELANGCGTSVNSIGVSLNRWRADGLVRVHGSATARPLRYEIGPKSPPKRVKHPMARKPKQASQIQITPARAKPDPASVNRAAADRDWARSRERAAAGGKPGQAETVEQWMARTGNKPEQLPGPTPVQHLTVPAFPGRG